MNRIVSALLLTLAVSCSQVPDSPLTRARAIRDDVCRCSDHECFQETSKQRWAPLSETIQHWSQTASPAERDEMEQIDRDIRGLCEARARYSGS